MQPTFIRVPRLINQGASTQLGYSKNTLTEKAMFTSVTYLQKGSHSLILNTNVPRYYEPDGTAYFQMTGVPTEEDARRIVKELGLDHLPFEVLNPGVGW